jgi:hypothetical protein
MLHYPRLYSIVDFEELTHKIPLWNSTEGSIPPLATIPHKPFNSNALQPEAQALKSSAGNKSGNSSAVFRAVPWPSTSPHLCAKRCPLSFEEMLQETSIKQSPLPMRCMMIGQRGMDPTE